MDANKLKYPIWTHDNNWAWKRTKENEVDELESRYLHEDWNDMIIIDSNLNMFKILNIEVLGKAGFFGYKFKLNRKYYKIKYNYKLIETLSLEKFKIYLINIIDANPSLYDSGLEIRKLIKQIKNSQNFLEIMNLLPNSD